MASPNLHLAANGVGLLAIWGASAWLVWAFAPWGFVARGVCSLLAFVPAAYIAHRILPRVTGPILDRVFPDAS